jgi:hypothetical protein
MVRLLLPALLFLVLASTGYAQSCTSKCYLTFNRTHCYDIATPTLFIDNECIEDANETMRACLRKCGSTGSGRGKLDEVFDGEGLMEWLQQMCLEARPTEQRCIAN